jgi:hypothetical protein
MDEQVFLFCRGMQSNTVAARTTSPNCFLKRRKAGGYKMPADFYRKRPLKASQSFVKNCA